MSDTADTLSVVEPRRRNPLVLILALVATVAAAALVWFFLITPLLLGDDAGADGTPDATSTSDDAVAAPAADETADAVADLDQLPVVTYEVFLARDPFDPVVPEPASTTTTTGDTGLVEPIADDGTSDDDAGTGDDVDDPPSGCTNGDEYVCDGRVVSLVELTGSGTDRLAVVQVDTTIYEVRTGEVFAGHFLLQSIGDDRVTIVYGDDVIVLEVGDRVLK